MESWKINKLAKILNWALILNILRCSFLDSEAIKYYTGGKSLRNLSLRIYDDPRKISGERLKEWNESMEVNPEELGEYVEGDILFPLEMGRNGLLKEAAKWPHGIIPYQINGNFTEEEKITINEAIEIYQNCTCLKFEHHTSNDTDWLEIVNKNEGCWASIGRRGGRQLVNLQTPQCLKRIGTVLHEFLHTIGFVHEQSRWERDSYITINWENIQKGKQRNFHKINRKLVSGLDVPYDYGSVMHYSRYTFSQNKQPTITVKQPNTKIGQRKQLSEKDIRKILFMYDCQNKQIEINGHKRKKEEEINKAPTKFPTRIGSVSIILLLILLI